MVESGMGNVVQEIWQEPGFAVLIAITLILGGYLIGAFLWD